MTAPAFIPYPGDEDHEIDTLHFAYGAIAGEWNGTTFWLADAPIPEGVPDALTREMPDAGRALIRNVQRLVGQQETSPVILLAPVVDGDGAAILPVHEHDEIAVNPNFVAHIQRTIPGGDWHRTPPAGWVDGVMRPYIVYVVDGAARGVIMPRRRLEADA